MDVKKLDSELNEVINELKINLETHEGIIKDTKQLGKEYNKYLAKVDAVLDNAEKNVNDIIILKEKSENAFNELSLENKNVYKASEEAKEISKSAIKESTEMLSEVSELNKKIDIEKGKATEKISFIENKKQDVENILAEVNSIILSMKNSKDNQTKLIEEYEKIKTKLNVKDEEMIEEYNKYLTKINFVLGNAEENVKNITVLKQKAENILAEVNNIMLSIKKNQDNQTKLIEEYEKIKINLNAKNEEMIEVIKKANKKVESMSKDYNDLNKTNFYLKIALILGTTSLICNFILFIRG